MLCHGRQCSTLLQTHFSPVVYGYKPNAVLMLQSVCMYLIGHHNTVSDDVHPFLNLSLLLL